MRTALQRGGPAIQNPGPLTAPTQNLTDYETLKRTFHNTATRCHDSGIRVTTVVFDGHAGGKSDSARTQVTCISHRTPSDINLLDLAQRCSSSLHGDSARAILRRVRRVASRDSPTSPDTDQWWQAWDCQEANDWAEPCPDQHGEDRRHHDDALSCPVTPATVLLGRGTDLPTICAQSTHALFRSQQYTHREQSTTGLSSLL